MITEPRALTLDDVQRVIGALTLELDQARREIVALRAQLETAGQATNSKEPAR